MRLSKDRRRRGRQLAGTLCAAGLAMGLLACGGGGSSSGGEAKGGGSKPILIGISAAKTGALAGYDLQAARALVLHLEQIDAAGGIAGRPVTSRWIDTKSDKTLSASNATQLINDGASVIVTSCDFDYGSPAAFAAAKENVPAISLCAGSPDNATPSIIGKLGFSMAYGSDTEGVVAAEWMRKAHPDWKDVYLLEDTSLEYTKAVAAYFQARFKQLGGTIAARDAFVGGTNADLSAQVTRLNSKVGQVDAIVLPSWNVAGATALRQIRGAGIDLPIVGDQALDGQLISQVAGSITGYYSLPNACVPSYCSGENNAALDKLAKDYKAKYGEDLANSYPINAWDLATVVKQAIEKAGSTDGAAIANAIETLPRIHGVVSDFHFSKTCHRPIGAGRDIVEYRNGKGEFVAHVIASEIPDIGGANSCVGKVKALP